MRVYLDASAILPLFVTDAHSAAMQAWSVGRVFLISDFGALEVAAAISRSYRMCELDELAARRALGKFDDWRMESTIQHATLAHDFKESERLIRNFHLKLSAPDALHLAIAMIDGVPMITFDQRLAAAARSVEHPVVMPGA